MDEEILKELQKMNKFLEQIDWKLWNFYDSAFNNASSAVSAASVLSTKTLVKTEASNPFNASTNAATVTTNAATVKPVISVPKYPSIEEL